MKKLDIIFLTWLFLGTLVLGINGNGRTALLRGTKQDPFLMGFGCRHQVEKKSHMVADPQICDRYLYCPKDSSGGIAMYCRPNRGFDEKEGKCLPLKDGKLDSCINRGASMFIANKPKAPCYNNPTKDEKDQFFNSAKQGYFKAAKTTTHAFFYCGPQNKEAILLECHDPKNPEVDLESKNLNKCFPSGHNKQKKAKKMAAAAHQRQFGGNSGGGNKKMIILNSGLRIFFDHFNRPVCPRIAKIIKNYNFGQHTRIQAFNSCTEYWTCSGVKTLKGKCPKMEVFNPILGICEFYENAQSPCNEEYKHESAIAHSLARAKHRKMLNDMELNQFSDVSQYYQQNIDRMTKSARDAAKQFGDDNHLVRNMRQKIAQWKKEQDSLSMRYKYLDQRANRGKRSPNMITPLNIGFLEDRRSKLYLAMNTKLELNENGHPICPEVPKKPHAHPYLKVLRYLQRPESRELSELYNLNGFAFGLYNRLPHPSNCGKYVVCGLEQEITQERKGLLQDCHNNTVFKPFQILDQGHQITIVNNTGICVDPLVDPVPGCENYQSFNPHVQGFSDHDKDKANLNNLDSDYMDGLDKDVIDYLWDEHWNQEWSEDLANDKDGLKDDEEYWNIVNSNSLTYTEHGNVIDDKYSTDDYYDTITDANETPATVAAAQLFTNGTSIDEKITPQAPWFISQRPEWVPPLSFSDDGIDAGAPSIVLNQTLPPTTTLLPVPNSTTDKVLSPSPSALPTLMIKKPEDDPLLKSVPAIPTTTTTTTPTTFKTISRNSQKIEGAFIKEQIEEGAEEELATTAPLNSVVVPAVARSQTLPAANYEMNPRGNLKYVYNNINRIEFQKGPENHILQPPLPALKVDQDDDLTYSGNEPLKGSSSTVATTTTTTAPTSTLPKSTTARATTFTAEDIAKMTTQEVIDYILGKKSSSTRKSPLAEALNLENSWSTKVAKDKVGTNTEDVISHANESVKASSTKTETEELTPTMKSKTTQTGGDEQQQLRPGLYQHQLQHEQVQDQQQRLMHFWI